MSLRYRKAPNHEFPPDALPELLKALSLVKAGVVNHPAVTKAPCKTAFPLLHRAVLKLIYAQGSHLDLIHGMGCMVLENHTVLCDEFQTCGVTVRDIRPDSRKYTLFIPFLSHRTIACANAIDATMW